MSDLGGADDLDTADALDKVAGMDVGFIGRRAGGYIPRLNTGSSVEPSDAIVGLGETAALLEIQGGKTTAATVRTARVTTPIRILRPSFMICWTLSNSGHTN